MNLGRFIPNKIPSSGGVNFSQTASRFATLTIAVGVMALIMAYAILNGFKKHIQNIVYDFNGQFEVGYVHGMYGLNSYPIATDSGLYHDYRERFKQIKEVRAVTYKGCVLQSNQEVQGIVIKAYDSLGLAAMNKILVAGHGIVPTSGRSVLLSESLAKKMKLEIGDDFVANIFSGNLKHRKLVVSGIFKTNLSEFDQTFIISAMPLVQGLNKWEPNQVGGFEVTLNPGEDEEQAYKTLRSEIRYDLELIKTRDKFFQLFEWLLILDQNVLVLIVILFVLVLFSIISTMYILIYERNYMVGVLKTLGANDRQILVIFRTWGVQICVYGLLIGNAVALLFLFLQKELKVVGLDPEHYYMDYVPVEIDFTNLAAINVISVLTIVLILTIPYLVISKMKPIDNIRFD